MAHITSAYSARSKTGTHPNTRGIPRPGTRIRAIYDLLMENKGKWIKVDSNKFQSVQAAWTSMTYLKNFYGLDIVGRGQGRGHKYGEWLLAGEWFGKVYIDYVVNPDVNTGEQSDAIE